MELISAIIKAGGHAVDGARVIRQLTGAQRAEALEELHNMIRAAKAQERSHEARQVGQQIGATSGESAEGEDPAGFEDAGVPGTDSADVLNSDVASLVDAGDGGILADILEWISDLF
jgi:hypothetical protein